MPLLLSLIHEPGLKSATAFQVNFDNHKEFLRAHGVRWQTTVLVFKGKNELGRSVADLDKSSLRALMKKGVE
ncbi:MAG: hypothetical protein O2807_14185 [bacterium]|nr:hypothetical protein [bacterium]